MSFRLSEGGPQTEKLIVLWISMSYLGHLAGSVCIPFYCFKFLVQSSVIIFFQIILIDRRIVGVAHVEDFESISDAKKRAICERRALELAKLLLKERRKFHAIDQIVTAIQQVK